MAHLTLEIPDDLARGLGHIAMEQKKSIEEVALERLRSLVPAAGSPKALLHALTLHPPVSPGVAAEMEAVIKGARLPMSGPVRIDE